MSYTRLTGVVCMKNARGRIYERCVSFRGRQPSARRRSTQVLLSLWGPTERRSSSGFGIGSRTIGACQPRRALLGTGRPRKRRWKSSRTQVIAKTPFHPNRGPSTPISIHPSSFVLIFLPQTHPLTILPATISSPTSAPSSRDE